MSQPPILHGYANSPFSEKIRLMFGHTGLAWQSLLVPPQPPRPSLDPVLAGYRRIPVLQIGADYICDSRLIGLEIAQRTGRPDLAADLCDAAVRADIERFDGPVFRAGVSLIPKSKLFWAAAKSNGLAVFKLIGDRRRMSEAGGFRLGSRAEAEGLWASHLGDLEARLAPGYLGGRAPNGADFSAYHSLWFAKDFARALDLDPFANLQRWYRDMAAIGHGPVTPISCVEALAQAQSAAPRALAPTEAAEMIGEMVEISPTDYARNGTVGRLVQSDGQRYVIARETDACGLIHAHFPKFGFQAVRCTR